MKRKRKRSKLRASGVNPQRFNKGQIKFYLYLIPLAVFMLLPIIFITMSAFKPIDELFAYPPRFFVKNPTLNNFIQLFSVSSKTNVPASRYLFNSIISTVLVMASTLLMSSAAGYVLSKKVFKLKKILFSINNLALMFVATAVAIPRYFVIVYSGLQNNFAANIIPLLAMPVGLFLVKQFIDQIPSALVEAAVIDGASDYKILTKIIIPLIKPALATIAILAFQTAWNSTEASTMYINKETLKTFSFYMTTLSNTSGNVIAGQGIAAAATLIMFLPNLILFIILQSQVMNTMAHSGLK
ncbi:MAG: transporter permease [Lachnospiraceae bacterium]|jgi:ABC-type glycerol-3-phosphate transport system permease component|nr:transporter permease [Anaerocolumna sp.]MDF2610235.1 transporter permease [Lachnospiraceae bacterium]